MLIMRQADEIGVHGYSHWTGESITPHFHSLSFVPQSIADGWEGYCSCGEWRGLASFYEFPHKDSLLNALRAAWSEHVEADKESGPQPT